MFSRFLLLWFLFATFTARFRNHSNSIHNTNPRMHKTSSHLSRIFTENAVELVNFRRFIGRRIRFLDRHSFAVLVTSDDVLSQICLERSDPHHNPHVLHLIVGFWFLKDFRSSLSLISLWLIKQIKILRKVKIFTKVAIADFSWFRANFSTTYRHCTQLLHVDECLVNFIHRF